MCSLLHKYDKVVSLGSNCLVKIFVDSVIKKQETQFFDNIGTSMWSINKLIETNFEGVFDIDEFCNLRILNTGKDQYIITNKKLYLVFKHDFYQSQTKPFVYDPVIFDKFIYKYQRRIKRFNELLSSDQSLLFIRLEQSNSIRVMYEEYADKFVVPEIEYVKEFSSLIKTINPEKKFLIIYISKKLDNAYDTDNNIIVVRDTYNIVDWTKCIKQLRDLFNDNKEFLFNYSI